MAQKTDKEPTLVEAFEDLKQMALEFGAAKTDFKFNDADWEYTLTVKRLKK